MVLATTGVPAKISCLHLTAAAKAVSYRYKEYFIDDVGHRSTIVCEYLLDVG